MKFAVETLGCKVNQYESEFFINELVKHGYRYVKLNKNPDLIIINSCTVTNEAKRQSLQLLRKAKRINPNAKIVFTGCVVDEYSDIKADFVISNYYKKDLPKILQKKCEKCVKDIFLEEKFAFLPLNKFFNTTRGFLKIQDGCNNYCSYCKIIYVRGKPRSLPENKVVSEILRLSQKVKEIVLCGINIQLYGIDYNKTEGLLNLLFKIEEELQKKGVKNLRIRLSSLKPDKISENFVKFINASKFFCNHYHLSIQNFNDKILNLMNRQYSYSQIKDCIELIKSYNELTNIGADIITGFPQENKKIFENNLKKMEELDINYFHIFPFSLKKGTDAEKFNDRIPLNEKRERVKILKRLAEKKREQFLQKNLNVTQRVLIEQKINNHYFGYSDNYLKIFLKLDLNQLKNSFVNVICKKVKQDVLEGGELV